MLNPTPPNGTKLSAWSAAFANAWSAWRVLSVMSPRYSELVLFSAKPGVLVRALAGPSDGSTPGMPGLRILGTEGEDHYVLVYLPTQAVVSVRPLDSGYERREPLSHSSLWEYAIRDMTPLRDDERELLDRIPRFEPDAEQLIASTLVRLTAAAPDGLWTLNKLGYGSDPRPLADMSYMYRMAGESNCTVLEWVGEPHPFDVAVALTDPLIGLPDAVCYARPRRPIVVHYRNAVLLLRN